MHVTDPSALIATGATSILGWLTLRNGQRIKREEVAKQSAIDKKAEEAALRAQEKEDSSDEAKATDRAKADAADWERKADKYLADLEKLRSEIDFRNGKLAGFGTNYAEMFSLMEEEGSVELLRRYRTVRRQARFHDQNVIILDSNKLLESTLSEFNNADEKSASEKPTDTSKDT